MVSPPSDDEHSQWWACPKVGIPSADHVPVVILPNGEPAPLVGLPNGDHVRWRSCPMVNSPIDGPVKW